ncbi:glycoside hydrolase family 5 protein [Laccaria amethystina LaAM-08-1]|uniref:Glycoside hydrolase family 5 protein n=1 Tax=Laccaria amethystina LaAM-08-1 TaxID=1095629 RepID=A0A0C9XRN3_9AGAR|nr:glycoside hydrolase family 5 protein [Laccaria amethystina LaAM-08-1]
MATCFWAGATYAPKLLVKDRHGKEVSIQEYLQSAFLDMWELVARSVGDLEGVLGFEMMNEPHRGYIQIPSLHAFDYNTDLHLSHVPSAFQSFQLGAGHPTLVSTWTRSFPMPTKKTSTTLLNTSKRKAWRPDGPSNGRCLWELHHVWGWDNVKDQPVVLQENYFSKNPVTGKKVDWYTDFYYPLLNQWAERVRTITSPDKLIFVEPIPNEFCPTSLAEHQPANMVFAPHWYDLNALFAKAYGDFTVNVQGLSRGMFPLKTFYWGHKGARENYTLQIRNIVEKAYDSLGERPVLLGECGVPMDMNKGEAFETGDFKWQARMMDALITALEQSLIGFTLWNYNPANDDQRGDDWNGENFSWFSRGRALPSSLLYYEQDAPSLDNGGRILQSIVRPYAAKTAGIPIHFQYEMNTGAFTYTWVNSTPNPASQTYLKEEKSIFKPPRTAHPALTSLETEIFLPSQLAHGRRVIVKGLDPGGKHRYDESRQTLFIVCQDTTLDKVHSIVVSLDPPPVPAFAVNDFWGDFGGMITSILVAIAAILAYFFLH